MATSAAAIRGAPSAALQVKPVAKVRSFGPAKLSKKELEKTLEKNRVQRESLRAQIEKNKKEKAAEKKKTEAKEMKKAGKDLKKCSKLALKKPTKLGKIEAAPKEEIVPTVEAPAVPVTAEFTGLAEIEKQEEEERAHREWVRVEIEWIQAEIEKTRKEEEEEERKKQEEKKREVGQAIKSLRKQIGDYAIVEPASPTRVLSDWSSSGSCSPCSSTATFESDDHYDLRF